MHLPGTRWHPAHHQCRCSRRSSSGNSSSNRRCRRPLLLRTMTWSDAADVEPSAELVIFYTYTVSLVGDDVRNEFRLDSLHRACWVSEDCAHVECHCHMRTVSASIHTVHSLWHSAFLPQCMPAALFVMQRGMHVAPFSLPESGSNCCSLLMAHSCKLSLKPFLWLGGGATSLCCIVQRLSIGLIKTIVCCSSIYNTSS
jgi:hypothetical protein